MFSPGFHQFHVFTRFSLKMKQQCRMRLARAENVRFFKSW